MTRIITALSFWLITVLILYLSKTNAIILPAFGVLLLTSALYEYLSVIEKKTLISEQLKTITFVSLLTAPFLLLFEVKLSFAYLSSTALLLITLLYQAKENLSLFNHWLTRLTPGFILISLGGAALISLSNDLSLLLLLILITTINDVTAYELGSVFQGPKLAPAISPKKTIVGSVTGLAAAVGFGTLFLMFQGITPNMLQILYLTIAVLFAQAGDLLKSVVKRENEVKDFGDILPGHGGILDRLDGILMAAIVISQM